MRGYPSQRFNDKAAIYYAAELRLIPRWNPFERWDWIQKYVGIQWLQFVPFVEVGRVSSSWSLDEQHSDMKWDVPALVSEPWPKAWWCALIQPSRKKDSEFR